MLEHFLWFIACGNGKQFPQYWKNDPEEGGRNLYEGILGTTEVWD
jgi:hypothetical protein